MFKDADERTGERRRQGEGIVGEDGPPQVDPSGAWLDGQEGHQPEQKPRLKRQGKERHRHCPYPRQELLRPGPLLPHDPSERTAPGDATDPGGPGGWGRIEGRAQQEDQTRARGIEHLLRVGEKVWQVPQDTHPRPQAGTADRPGGC